MGWRKKHDSTEVKVLDQNHSDHLAFHSIYSTVPYYQTTHGQSFLRKANFFPKETGWEPSNCLRQAPLLCWCQHSEPFLAGYRNPVQNLERLPTLSPIAGIAVIALRTASGLQAKLTSRSFALKNQLGHIVIDTSCSPLKVRRISPLSPLYHGPIRSMFPLSDKAELVLSHWNTSPQCEILKLKTKPAPSVCTDNSLLYKIPLARAHIKFWRVT